MANRNLVGYFRGEDVNGDCTLYAVRFVPVFQDHWPWVEIDLAGDEPFVVQYETIKTPFEPLMKSRATIRAVASEYFMDMYGPYAQSTEVVFTNEDTNEVLWRGYLTNNLMNMPQDGCNETFNMEAIDCLSVLEYFDYVPVNGESKQIVTFQQILSNVLQSCGPIDTLYVDNSIQNENGDTIHLDELKISEQNFFSSDTDEPWTMLEVLEEMCRFCGYTAVQWKSDIYLFDRQAHAPLEWVGNTDITSSYNCDVSSGTFLTYETKNALKFYNCTLHQDDIKKSGADISLETIYNKVTVQDSFYEIGDFIPDLYEDDLMHNTIGEEWEYNKLTHVSPTKPIYINNKDERKEDASESGITFYQRQFIHDWYTSVYRDKTTLTEITPTELVWDTTNYNLIRNDYGQVTGCKLWMRVYNKTDETKSVTVTLSSLSLSDSQTKDIDGHYYQDYYLELYHPSEGVLPNLKYTVGSYGPYDIPGQVNMSYTRDYVGATIVDCASIKSPNTEQYNYEVDNTINFNRYICINQNDNPDDYHSNPRYTGFTPAQLNQYFLPVMELNSGWTKPIIIDDKCYLAINGKAIFERYTDRDYINEDWTSDCTGINKKYNLYAWGTFSGEREVHTNPPCLVFKLAIGDYYWDGTQWTTTERPFYVNLHTPTDDDGFIDFSAWWNEEHEVINNIPWDDWTGVDGYKIPLTGVNFNWNDEIKFEICLPNKIQIYIGNKTHDGMNSYCWLDGIKVEFATKGQENYDLADVIYENVIDEFSVNELSDITLKFTTYPNEGQHSYSNVGYNGQLINNVIKLGLDGVANKMEENIVKKYVNQYSTNTISQNMTLNLKATPISRIKDTSNGKFFHVCGLEIDYADSSQRVHMIESKKYNQD